MIDSDLDIEYSSMVLGRSASLLRANALKAPDYESYIMHHVLADCLDDLRKSDRDEYRPF